MAFFMFVRLSTFKNLLCFSDSVEKNFLPNFVLFFLKRSLKFYKLQAPHHLAFTGGSVGKESTFSAGDRGDMDLIPG